MDQEGGGKAELSARSSSTNQERNNSAVAGRTCRCLLRWYSVSPGTAIALSTDLGVASAANGKERESRRRRYGSIRQRTACEAVTVNGGVDRREDSLSAPPSWATASTKRSCSWRVHLSRALASSPRPCCCCPPSDDDISNVPAAALRMVSQKRRWRGQHERQQQPPEWSRRGRDDDDSARLLLRRRHSKQLVCSWPTSDSSSRVIDRMPDATASCAGGSYR